VTSGGGGGCHPTFQARGGEGGGGGEWGLWRMDGEMSADFSDRVWGEADTLGHMGSVNQGVQHWDF